MNEFLIAFSKVPLFKFYLSLDNILPKDQSISQEDEAWLGNSSIPWPCQTKTPPFTALQREEGISADQLGMF